MNYCFQREKKYLRIFKNERLDRIEKLTKNRRIT